MHLIYPVVKYISKIGQISKKSEQEEKERNQTKR
jgi:hypothetical protein